MRPHPFLLLALLLPVGCDRSRDVAPVASSVADRDVPTPLWPTANDPVAYVGDAACRDCHAAADTAWQSHAMARSFHRWTAARQIEPPLSRPLVDARRGLAYTVEQRGDRLWQVEQATNRGGDTVHRLARRIDWVMGSGRVARTYFTEEGGGLFQLPLTWFRDHGWDWSPGYEVTNARFDRLLPDRCLACHSSYPEAAPRLEGKYPTLREGIGCERCHGPGARHVARWQGQPASAGDSTRMDSTIVTPSRLPLVRRMEVCEQCHVHTAVAVLRPARTAFDYRPSARLSDHWAYFSANADVDVVSHADRLTRSACFTATAATARPLECATCHAAHGTGTAAPAADRSASCASCHAPAALARRFAGGEEAASHGAGADCVRCHMPRTRDRGVPHGSFTDHWIRRTREAPAVPPPAGEVPITPYFARDRTGPEADAAQGIGGLLYASLAGDRRALVLSAARLEGAARLLPARGDVAFYLGVAWTALDRAADATRQLETAIRADSTQPEWWRALAQARRAAGQPTDEVMTAYRAALAVQPALAWIRGEYASALAESGRDAAAVAEYRRAVREQPSLATAWFGLGAALTGLGRTAEATAAFRQAAALDPALAVAGASVLLVGDGVVRRLPPVTAHPLAAEGAANPLEPTADGGLRLGGIRGGGPLTIVRADGTPVRVLAPGTDVWDLRDARGQDVGSGLYRVAGGRRDGPGDLTFAIARRAR